MREIETPVVVIAGGTVIVNVETRGGGGSH